MDNLLPLEYQIALLRTEYRNTSNLPITTQASILLGSAGFSPIYPITPYLYPSLPLLFGGWRGHGHHWGRRW